MSAARGRTRKRKAAEPEPSEPGIPLTESGDGAQGPKALKEQTDEEDILEKFIKCRENEVELENIWADHVRCNQILIMYITQVRIILSIFRNLVTSISRRFSRN